MEMSGVGSHYPNLVLRPGLFQSINELRDDYALKQQFKVFLRNQVSATTVLLLVIFLSIVNGAVYIIRVWRFFELQSRAARSGPNWEVIFVIVLSCVNAVILLLVWLIWFSLTADDDNKTTDATDNYWNLEKLSTYSNSSNLSSAGNIFATASEKEGRREGDRGKDMHVRPLKIWCVRNRITLQNVFIIGISFVTASYLLASTLVGACDYGYSDNDLNSFMCNPNHLTAGLPLEPLLAVLFVPLCVFFILKDSSLRIVLSSSVMIGASLIVSAILVQPKCLLFIILIYFPANAFIVLEGHRQNYAVFHNFKKLKNALAEQFRIQDEIRNTELRHIISNVAHDLKSPLASMIHGIDIVENVCDVTTQHHQQCTLTPAMQMEAHCTVSEAVRGMRSTNAFMVMSVNRCIDFARASRGLVLNPTLRSVSLEDAIGEPLGMLRFLIAPERVRLTIIDTPPPITIHAVDQANDNRDIEAAPHALLNHIADNNADCICPHIETDKQWLVENLLCLLSNAAKYAPRKSVIELRVCRVSRQQRTQYSKNNTITGNQQPASGQPSAPSLPPLSPNHHAKGAPNKPSRKPFPEICGESLSDASASASASLPPQQPRIKPSLNRSSSTYLGTPSTRSSTRSSTHSSTRQSDPNSGPKPPLTSPSGRTSSGRGGLLGGLMSILNNSSYQAQIAPADHPPGAAISAESTDTIRSVSVAVDLTRDDSTVNPRAGPGEGSTTTNNSISLPSDVVGIGVGNVPPLHSTGMHMHHFADEERGCASLVNSSSLGTMSASSTTLMYAGDIEAQSSASSHSPRPLHTSRSHYSVSSSRRSSRSGAPHTQEPHVETMAAQAGVVGAGVDNHTGASAPRPNHSESIATRAGAETGAGAGASTISHYTDLMLKFEVLDHGPRMDPEISTNLFLTTRQASRATGGTGLGLYTLAKRVDALGGACGMFRESGPSLTTTSTSTRETAAGAAAGAGAGAGTDPTIRVGQSEGPESGRNCFWFTIPYLPLLATGAAENGNISTTETVHVDLTSRKDTTPSSGSAAPAAVDNSGAALSRSRSRSRSPTPSPRSHILRYSHSFDRSRVHTVMDVIGGVDPSLLHPSSSVSDSASVNANSSDTAGSSRTSRTTNVSGSGRVRSVEAAANSHQRQKLPPSPKAATTQKVDVGGGACVASGVGVAMLLSPRSNFLLQRVPSCSDSSLLRGNMHTVLEEEVSPSATSPTAPSDTAATAPDYRTSRASPRTSTSPTAPVPVDSNSSDEVFPFSHPPPDKLTPEAKTETKTGYSHREDLPRSGKARKSDELERGLVPELRLQIDDSSSTASAGVSTPLGGGATSERSKYVSLPQEQQQQQQPRLTGLGIGEPGSSKDRQLNVLVVDDSLTILKMTSMMLTQQGHTVARAENGAEAVDAVLARAVSRRNSESATVDGSSGAICNRPFDVVIMDLQMPVMDGFEAIRRLRKEEKEAEMQAEKRHSTHSNDMGDSTIQDQAHCAGGLDHNPEQGLSEEEQLHLLSRDSSSLQYSFSSAGGGFGTGCGASSERSISIDSCCVHGEVSEAADRVRAAAVAALASSSPRAAASPPYSYHPSHKPHHASSSSNPSSSSTSTSLASALGRGPDSQLPASMPAISPRESSQTHHRAYTVQHQLIIAASANSSQEAAEEALAAGADAFIPKPFSAAALYSTIDHYRARLLP